VEAPVIFKVPGSRFSKSQHTRGKIGEGTDHLKFESMDSPILARKRTESHDRS